METEKKKVFKDVKYFLVTENSELKQILKDGGAIQEYYITELVGCIVSNTCNFSQFKESMEMNIPIVTADWVHMSVKCDTLLPYAAFSPDRISLFGDVCFCPSQIPTSEKASLLAMMIYYGGRYSIKLNKNCTHLVVGKPSGKKYDFAMKQGNIKIVTTAWIIDSIKANEKLPENEYEPILASPRSPLKPFQGNVQQHTTPNLTVPTPSSFMTPLSQASTPSVDDVQKQDFGNKENNASITTAIQKQTPSDLLKGFVFIFSGYEERLPPETFAIWEEVIKKASGVIKETYCPEVTHVICLHQQSPVFKKALSDGKKIATAYWLNDVLVARRVFSPNTPLHLPVPFTDTIPQMKTSLITVSGYEGRERILVKHMINFLGAQYTGHMTRGHTHLICKNPDGEKYKKAVEWNIPVVTPKWLGDMIQTGQSFPCKGKCKYTSLGVTDELEINPTFSSHITDIWNNSLNAADHIITSRKRKLSTKDEEVEPKEKQRKMNFPPNVKRVLFTGLTGATVHKLRQNVMKLKGELAKGVNDCTHLVAPKITRTVKFLSAVSICKFLVAPAWVDDSFEAKAFKGTLRKDWFQMSNELFQDESNYTLVDPESEDLFGFKLKRSLQRAQTRQVCKGLHFHVTPSILPAPNAMREIIECAGGKMTELKNVDDLKNIFISNVLKDHSYNSFLVSCMDDKKLWNDAVKEGYDVYNVELILSGVMKQELEWNLYPFHSSSRSIV